MKFGLIGHPIAHSMSPSLFKAAYDGRFPYDLIQGEDFEASYRRFLEEYDGINVTAPFKELAYARADILSDECRLVQASNLLVKTPEGVKAYNSDFLGVRMWLEGRFLGFARNDVKDARNDMKKDREDMEEAREEKLTVLIVGCGGAGRAAAAAAVSLGMKTLLMNRNIERAENLAKDLKAMGYEAETRPVDDFCTCFRQSDIIIYNIPSAIPQLDCLTDMDFAAGRAKFILEANYKDPSFDETFVRRMKEANPLAGYTGGRTWLLNQAVTGYEIFTSERPDLKKMSDVL